MANEELQKFMSKENVDQEIEELKRMKVQKQHNSWTREHHSSYPNYLVNYSESFRPMNLICAGGEPKSTKYVIKEKKSTSASPVATSVANQFTETFGSEFSTANMTSKNNKQSTNILQKIDAELEKIDKKLQVTGRILLNFV